MSIICGEPTSGFTVLKGLQQRSILRPRTRNGRISNMQQKLTIFADEKQVFVAALQQRKKLFLPNLYININDCAAFLQ